MSLPFCRKLLCVAVLSGSSFSTQAQEVAAAPTQLPEVEVVGEHESGYATRRIVSATKTETSLRDVPQSISVVTRDQILDQAVQNIADVVRYVPGVSMAQGEGNRETPIFRGNSSTSDFFVDGQRDDVQYFRDLYNIERIEVLKGPNAMIFGRGGVGGVINRVTRQADWNEVREVNLQGGSYGDTRATFDLGQGFGETYAARVSGMIQESDSYRDGVILKRYGINPTFAARPGQNTTVTLGYEYFYDDRTADRGIASFQGRPFATDDSTFFGDPGRSPADTQVNAYSAVIEHHFGEAMTLRNSTRYGNYDKYYQNVFASGAVRPNATTQELEVPIQAYFSNTDRDNLFNQTDLVLKLGGGSIQHTLLAGIELGRQKTDNLRLSGRFADGADAETAPDDTFIAPAANPTIDQPLVAFVQGGSGDGNNESVTEIAAIYLQDQIEFSPQFQAVLGLRYDQFKVDFTNRRTDAGANSQLESDDGLLSPRVGLVYKPAEPLSLYASYTLAYQPRAGEQLSSLSPSNQALDPEEFENYEVGAKWDIRPDFSFTAAVYQLDRGNVAIADPNNAGQSILVDGQRTRGLELGISGNVTSAWSIAGGYAWQDGEVTRTQSATAQQGATLAQLPKNTFSLWNRYNFTSTWGAGLGLYKRSDMFTSTDNTVTLDGYTRVDAALFVAINEHLQAQLNVENLLDEEYIVNAHNNNNIMPGGPLALRASVRARF